MFESSSIYSVNFYVEFKKKFILVGQLIHPASNLALGLFRLPRRLQNLAAGGQGSILIGNNNVQI